MFTVLSAVSGPGAVTRLSANDQPITPTTIGDDDEREDAADDRDERHALAARRSGAAAEPLPVAELRAGFSTATSPAERTMARHAARWPSGVERDQDQQQFEHHRSSTLILLERDYGHRFVGSGRVRDERTSATHWCRRSRRNWTRPRRSPFSWHDAARDRSPSRPTDGRG